MSKRQFDEYLGGSGVLPHEAEINKLIAARANEISAMNYSIENPQQTKLIFQKLPVHMRRRVMSHNAKRMPRRLREAHTAQMEKSGVPPKAKRPSRKYRRRPQNLLREYTRRKRRKIWLETHIWHAKRFHMCEKWGYKIANFSNDRGFRASYRAVSQHCMIQDISYYNCIELKGPADILIRKLKIHCKGELSFGGKMYLNGSREGNLVFYRKNGSPLGTITFFWSPKKGGGGEKGGKEGEERALWIWVHPAFLKPLLEELSSTFELKESAKKGGKLQTFAGDENDCKMELITSFNRFRLRGPLSIAVISDTLRLSEAEDSSEDKIQIFETLGSLNSPSQLPRQCILGFTVADPRFFLPKRRKKAVLSQENCRKLVKIPESASSSPLWDPASRKTIESNFRPSSEINALRSRNLVPGVQNDAEYDQSVISKVPLILVQHPGTDDDEKSLGFSSGLDVILPSQWALPFWLAFIYRCTRPIGLREYRSVLFESLDLNSPEINHPDTSTYHEEAEKVKSELIEGYFRRPANRRINFTKFGVTSPFFCEWGILVKEWGDEGLIPQHEGLIPQHERLIPQNEGLIPRDEGLIPKNGGLVPQNEGLIPQSEGLVPQNEGLIPQNEGPIPQHEGLITQHEGLIPQHEGLIPQNEGPNPQHERLNSQHERLKPQHEGLKPQHEKLNPQHKGFEPQDEGLIPQHEELDPQHEGLIPRDEGFIPQNEGLVPQNEGLIPPHVKVLRDRKLLQSLNFALNNASGCRNRTNNNSNPKRRKKSAVQSNFLEEFRDSLDQSFLIPVRLTILDKGRPKNFALICLPNDDDLKDLKSDAVGPVEPLKNDPFEKRKRLMRIKHKETLKRLMRWRSRMKKEGKSARVHLKDQDHQDYERIMRSLYLPDCKKVRYSCSREVMGYVIHGDFSFSEAKGVGWGYIVLKSLFSLIKHKRNTVLVRNVQSRQYRQARLDIIC